MKKEIIYTIEADDDKKSMVGKLIAHLTVHLMARVKDEKSQTGKWLRKHNICLNFKVK